MAFKTYLLLEVLLFCLLLFFGSVTLVQDTDTNKLIDTSIIDTDTVSVDVKLNYFIQGLLGEQLPDSINK